MSRKICDSTVLGRRFLVSDKLYGQYNGLYTARLNAMRPRLSAKSRLLWGESKLRFAEKIIDCETSDAEDCVLIGTVYKEMPLRPSVKLTQHPYYFTWHAFIVYYTLLFYQGFG